MYSRVRHLFIRSFLAVGCLPLSDCVQQYMSPYKSPPSGYLVVEGYLTGNGPTRYTLTRTASLSGDSSIPVVAGAALQVEGDDNSIYPLTEESAGVYGISSLPLSIAVRYRLRVAIPNGETYLSNFVPYKLTPPIDSINWVRNAGGVTIYANTHDPANATHYYQWTYDQTWEYDAAEGSEYIYVPASNSLAIRPDSLMFFTCYKNSPVTNILIGNSTKLASDLIYEAPLVNIGAGTQPLAIEYSILVNQYALTDSGYAFFLQMQRNTESLGSIFDAQPSQLTGNIHSLSDPAEPVIGYISAGTQQQQRIFISSKQLPDWGYSFQCPGPDKLVPDNADSFKVYFGEQGYIPTQQTVVGMAIKYGGNVPGCIDCRTQGGVLFKPSFWPF